MPNILLSGLTGEGDTDRRFLTPLLRRTFEYILRQANAQIEVFDPVWLGVAKGAEIIEIAREKAADFHLYCFHIDTDSRDHQKAFQERVSSLLAATGQLNALVIPVPVFPVKETEAWMLADLDTLRSQLKTALSTTELGLHGRPEDYGDPKARLQEAVRLSNLGQGRHLQTELADLYDLLGTNVSLSTLEKRCPSYGRFLTAVKDALRMVGYLHK